LQGRRRRNLAKRMIEKDHWAGFNVAVIRNSAAAMLCISRWFIAIALMPEAFITGSMGPEFMFRRFGLGLTILLWRCLQSKPRLDTACCLRLFWTRTREIWALTAARGIHENNLRSSRKGLCDWFVPFVLHGKSGRYSAFSTTR
jgi:hypothetical protein